MDDVQTADALGHLVIGPALLSLGLSSDERLQDPELTNPFHRRAEVMALMAAMPEPVRGPAAAAHWRETLQADEITFVEEAMDAHIANGLWWCSGIPAPLFGRPFQVCFGHGQLVAMTPYNLGSPSLFLTGTHG